MPFPLLVLALGLAAAMEIQVPEEPVVALFGQDATLLCSFSPEANFSVAELSLIWQLKVSQLAAMEIQVPEEPVVALFGQDATLLCSFSPEANFSVAELSLIWQLKVSQLAAMEIQVPEEPVVALFGQDATLLCSFSPEANFSVAELSLIWQLTDTKRLVHGFSGGRDLLQDQGGGYANRTALFYDQLPRGNVSLLLRRVRIADEGSFTCFVRVRDYDSAAVALQVAAPYSKPSVHLEPSRDLKPGDVAEVTCHASRGYPEASVLWQDSRGANLTANVSTWQVANEEGLFEVRSVLRVLLEPGVTYSCLVLNAALRQHGHASVTVTGQPLAFPAVALWVTVALAVCVVALLGLLAFVCHQKLRQSCREDEERAGQEERDEEGEEPKTALQLLENSESREGREQEID